MATVIQYGNEVMTVTDTEAASVAGQGLATILSVTPPSVTDVYILAITEPSIDDWSQVSTFEMQLPDTVLLGS